MKGICAFGNLPKAFSEALNPGDLLVWIAYDGLDSKWADYGRLIREAGLNLVVSHAAWRPPPEGENVKAFIPHPTLCRMPTLLSRIALMERDCGVMKTPMALKVSSFGFMRTILPFFFAFV